MAVACLIFACSAKGIEDSQVVCSCLVHMATSGSWTHDHESAKQVWLSHLWAHARSCMILNAIICSISAAPFTLHILFPILTSLCLYINFFFRMTDSCSSIPSPLLPHFRQLILPLLMADYPVAQKVRVLLEINLIFKVSRMGIKWLLFPWQLGSLPSLGSPVKAFTGIHICLIDS